LEVFLGVTETVHLIAEVSTIIHVITLKVIWNASSVSARVLTIPAPTEDFIGTITTLVVAITDILEILASVIGTNEFIDVADTFVFLVCHQSFYLRAIFLAVTQPLTGDANIGSRALVLVVRASLTEQFIRPIVTVIVVIAFEFFVNASTVHAGEFSRWANPAI